MSLATMQLHNARVPLCRTHRARASRRTVAAKALFGWGSDAERKADKDEQWRVQQELLEKRRSGSLIKEANERRQKVQETLRSKKDERKKERESLSQGIIPDALKKWKPYDNKLDEEANSGIIIPLLPLGIKKYDDGERFDLRSPYADDGWVDPDETDMWAGFKKLLPFGKKEEGPKDKKIIWASEYDKYLAEKKANQQQKKK